MLLPFRERLVWASQEVRQRFRLAKIRSEIDPVFARTQPNPATAGVPVVDIFMKNVYEVRDVAKIFN